MCSGNCSGGCAACETIMLDRGMRGLPGQAATLTVGTTTTGAPGSQALVTPSGTLYAQIFDFVIPAGADGTPGTNGANAWTLTVSTSPVIGGDGAVFVVNVLDTSWMGVGQMLHLTDAGNTALGYFEVFTIVSPTQVMLRNPRVVASGFYINNANGSTVTVGSKLTAGGIQGPAGLTGTAATLAAGTTTTLAAGSPATVTAVGTLSAQIFNFGIPTGATGASGHTPVTTFSNADPVGGVAGDLHVKQVNGGLIQFWANTAGFWNAGVSVLANRLLGYGAASPVGAGLIANTNDTYWQTGVNPSMWIYTGGIWTILFTVTGGGGGSVGTFQQVSDASPTLGSGRRTGTNIWVMERSLQYNTLQVGTATPLTYTFDTAYQYQKLVATFANFTIDWSPVALNQNCEWVFEIYNAFGGQINIAYAANRWTKNQGVTQPVVVNATQSVVLHCYYTKGLMNIVLVEQNMTVI